MRENTFTTTKKFAYHHYLPHDPPPSLHLPWPNIHSFSQTYYFRPPSGDINLWWSIIMIVYYYYISPRPGINGSWCGESPCTRVWVDPWSPCVSRLGLSPGWCPVQRAPPPIKLLDSKINFWGRGNKERKTCYHKRNSDIKTIPYSYCENKSIKGLSKETFEACKPLL